MTSQHTFEIGLVSMYHTGNYSSSHGLYLT